MKSLRVLIGDDHWLILDGVRGLLQNCCDVVGSEKNGKDLLDAAIRLQPDIVVLDVTMPFLNGIDAALEIKKTLPSCKLVFLSMHSNPLYLRKALEAGASGYVLKSGASEELLVAIEAAVRGKVYVSPGFGDFVMDNVRAEKPRSTGELTGRQKQILQLVAEGKQSKEIAEITHISVRTVEFHRSRLMAKLGETNVAGLTRFAIREGLVDDPGQTGHQI